MPGSAAASNAENEDNPKYRAFKDECGYALGLFEKAKVRVCGGGGGGSGGGGVAACSDLCNVMRSV